MRALGSGTAASIVWGERCCPGRVPLAVGAARLHAGGGGRRPGPRARHAPSPLRVPCMGTVPRPRLPGAGVRTWSCPETPVFLNALRLWGPEEGQRPLCRSARHTPFSCPSSAQTRQPGEPPRGVSPGGQVASRPRALTRRPRASQCSLLLFSFSKQGPHGGGRVGKGTCEEGS